MFSRTARILAFAGGLMQVLAVLGLLFLPVFATCYVNEPECRRETYIQMGGSPLGYVLLGGMAFIGTAIVVTSTGQFLNMREQVKRRILWFGVVWSLATLILGAWSIGLAFAPGALLLLLAAFAIRKEYRAYQRRMS